MIDVPPEIWYRIACFMPDKELRRLLGVNRVFFDLGVNLRWKVVTIENRDTYQTKRILDRLMDPFVARRVQHLKLLLTYVKERRPRAGQENAKGFDYLKHQLYDIVDRFKHKREKREIEIIALGIYYRHPRPKFSDLMEAITEATTRMVNVKELTIYADVLPPSYDDFKTLFVSFWASFGALRLLSLHGSVEAYQVLIEGYRELIAESNPCLKQLEELRVEFTRNLFRADRAADTAILTDVVAPFIHDLSPHLKVLGICSWLSEDLSMLFKRLAVLRPVIHHLGIYKAFDRTLADPSGLKQLLCEGSETLEKLDLCLNTLRFPPNLALDEPLSRWLANCVEDESCFSRLRYLNIDPTPTPAGIDILLASIRRASTTIGHLIIRNRCLQPPEASLVLEAVSRCANLTHLKMKVRGVDVALLDLFAAKAPWVECIYLWSEEDSSYDERVPLFISGNSTMEM